MRLIGVTTVRDEADIFEAFARHNLHFLDEIYVVLHRSRDGTREIASALKKEGLALRLFEDEREGFVQDAVINSLARRAFAEAGADFVFPIDADEFLLAEDRTLLEASLRALPPGVAGLLRSQTYACTSDDDAALDCPTRRITHRYDLGPDWRASTPSKVDAEFCKVVVGRWFQEDATAAIYEGNHAVFRDGKLAMTPCAGIEVAHFPVRSLEQLQRKVTLGWLSIIASGRDAEASGIARHWKEMFERFRETGALTWEDLARFVAAYVPTDRRRLPLAIDPIADHVGTMRHVSLQRPRTLAYGLMEFAERMAREQRRK